MASLTPRRRKILFLVTEDWAFLTHRLPMARAARAAGAEVVVASRTGAATARIRELGYRVVPVAIDRGSLNPLRELATVARLVAILRRERPDILHNIALKPILDGTLAARFAPVPRVIDTFAGMGAVFIAEDGGLLRRFLIAMFRWLLRAPSVTVMVQNEDDRRLLQEFGIGCEGRTVLVPGSGVDVETFSPAPEPDGTVTATFVGRLLWDKGVGELVEAARILKNRGVALRIRCVGLPDPANPRSVNEDEVHRWVRAGLIDWQGYCADIDQVWAESHIAVLPSYREGLPKSLLEAAACGRPLVATDVPGCRALVRDGENGLLVPVREAAALADALQRLAEDAALRARLGAAARADAETLYADAAIETQTAELYRRLLAVE